jgi:hypothetical protein
MAFLSKFFNNLKENKMDEEKVILNGTQVTRRQLNEKVEEAKQQKGVSIKEVSPQVFKTRIQG